MCLVLSFEMRFRARTFYRALKLGELLHQLLHAMLLKLYCNLGIFPIAFAAKDDAFAIFGVADARALAQAGRAGGRVNVQFGAHGKLRRLCRRRRRCCPASRRRCESGATAEALRGVVAGRGRAGRPPSPRLHSCSGVAPRPRRRSRALRIRCGIGAAVRLRPPRLRSSIRRAGTSSRKREGMVGLGHVVAVAATVARAGNQQRVHGAGHADVAEATLFFHLLGVGERARVGKRPSSIPARNTSGNSRPLAACSVMSVTRASAE